MPTSRPSSKAPKIVGGVVALLIIGGAALQFTPVGAFGHLAISDAVRKGEYLKTSQSAGDAARKKLATDTWAAAKGANDELAESRKKFPRARPLAAMAAFMELSAQVRFGQDIERGARAKLWLAEIPPNTDVQYQAAAVAAQVLHEGVGGLVDGRGFPRYRSSAAGFDRYIDSVDGAGRLAF